MFPKTDDLSRICESITKVITAGFEPLHSTKNHDTDESLSAILDLIKEAT